MDATDQALQELFAERWVAIGFGVFGGKSGQQIVDCFGGVGYGMGEQVVAERIVTDHNSVAELQKALQGLVAAVESMPYVKTGTDNGETYCADCDVLLVAGPNTPVQHHEYCHWHAIDVAMEQAQAALGSAPGEGGE